MQLQSQQFPDTRSVTPRTAGFNTTDLTRLSETGILVMILLMLVGGSPGSTAGGMKTTTVAVLFASAVSVFRKKEYIDGVEVIRKIRTWSNMPIIVISARSEDTDKIDALDAGADDYLTKPFSVEELLARLRVTQRRLTVMHNETAVESSVFINEALRIDYAAGCAFLGEEELHLTPIEYKLLCLLSRNVEKF